MTSKTDYAITALVGFLVGVFAIPTLFNLGVRQPFLLAALPIVVPPVWIFGVWLGAFLSRWISFLAQFSKFAAVGFLNTAIDFGTLNLLSAATGVTAGLIIGGVNIPGFTIAVFNSYFWNKLWVFKDREETNIFADLPKFLLITFIGLIINSGIIVIGTTYAAPAGGYAPNVWLNLVKVAATAISLVWNFVGYKFLVFNTRGGTTALTQEV